MAVLEEILRNALFSTADVRNMWIEIHNQAITKHLVNKLIRTKAEFEQHLSDRLERKHFRRASQTYTHHGLLTNIIYNAPLNC